MINANHNEGYDLICDICGHTVTGLDTFKEARDYAKENGWKTEKYNGAWENYCPECQELGIDPYGHDLKGAVKDEPMSQNGL